MNECAVCPTGIKNKAKLQCPHKICLECIIKILGVNPGSLRCPMCREIYKDVYPGKESGNEGGGGVFELPIQGHVSIHLINGFTFTDMLAPHYPNDVCPFFGAFIHDVDHVGIIKVVVIHNVGITDEQIGGPLYKLITDAMPLTDNSTQKLGQRTATVGGPKIPDTGPYLQNYDHSMLIGGIGAAWSGG